MPPDAAISLDKVTKDFGTVRALEEINLVVEPNQVFGFIGPDGAGKTTAMRILSTVMRPTSGAASVFGYDVVNNPWPIKHRIGYMPQTFSLYRDLSVAENIAFYAGIYRVSKHLMSERIKWLLDFTGLGPFTDRVAMNLSGGMKQKLALACALIHEPDLLLLDEPTTGVDPLSRREFWRNIEGLVARGKTVFVSTPYMDEAERCHRISFINEGRIVREGSVEEIKRTVSWKQFGVRGAGLRDLLRILRERAGIIGVQLVGTVLRIQGDIELTKEKIIGMLPTTGKYEVEELHPSLEDVFAQILGSTKSGDRAV